ncbi:hypothetical protein ACS0TY_009725 [Phlomoides rotata]
MDVEIFYSFIRGTSLINMPLHGRSFTWYKPYGSCKSRIDGILVNNDWLWRWSNSSYRELKLSLSDHCSIILEIKPKDWGPKSFRCLNAWLCHPNFRDFVKDKWCSYSIDGWGSFVIKENLKK